MKRCLTTLAVLLCWAGAARAQTASDVSLLPVDPSRWDVSGEAGWLTSNKSAIAVDWNDWLDVATGGGAVGYYWTPHLRSELRAAFTSEGRVFEQQRIVLPGLPYPIYSPREHRFRTRTVAGGLHWQFFENQWFHPSAGGGVEVVSEREAGAGTSVAVRPFVATGFKWYVTDRGFTRSDVRVSFGSGRVAHVTWAAGIGVDL